MNDYFAGSEFKQPRVWPDLLAAIAAAKQDDIHVEFVLKLAVGQQLNKFRHDLNIAKCLDHSRVVFDYTWHLKNGAVENFRT